MAAESRSDTWDCASVGRAIGKSTGAPNWKLLISPKECVASSKKAKGGRAFRNLSI